MAHRKKNRHGRKRNKNRALASRSQQPQRTKLPWWIAVLGGASSLAGDFNHPVHERVPYGGSVPCHVVGHE